MPPPLPLLAGGAVEVEGAAAADRDAVAAEEEEGAPFSPRGASAELKGLVNPSPLQSHRRSPSKHARERPFPRERAEDEVRERCDVRSGDVALAALIAAAADAADAKAIASFDLEKVEHERGGEQEPPYDGRVDPRDPFLRPARRGFSSGGGRGHMEEQRERGRGRKKTESLLKSLDG